MLDYDARKRAQQITYIIAQHFKVTVDSLTAPRSTKHAASPMYVKPRRLAMFFLRKEGMSFPQIGEYFNRDHSTVIQSCRNAEEDADLIAELQHKLEHTTIANVIETCPNCRRLELEVAEMRLLVLEMKMRFGCG